MTAWQKLCFDTENSFGLAKCTQNDLAPKKIKCTDIQISYDQNQNCFRATSLKQENLPLRQEAFVCMEPSPSRHNMHITCPRSPPPIPGPLFQVAPSIPSPFLCSHSTVFSKVSTFIRATTTKEFSLKSLLFTLIFSPDKTSVNSEWKTRNHFKGQPVLPSKFMACVD